MTVEGASDPGSWWRLVGPSAEPQPARVRSSDFVLVHLLCSQTTNNRLRLLRKGVGSDYLVVAALTQTTS